MATLADFASSIECTPDSFKELCAHFDPDWVALALSTAALGRTTTVRKRKLPAEQAMWLVIGMALFRDRSIQEVVDHLDLVIGDNPGISAGALPAARGRVGAEAVQLLFELSASQWSQQYPDTRPWCGLSLWAMDGSCFNLPDTKDNDRVFGRPINGKHQGAFPQARVAMLLNVRSRVAKGLAVGEYLKGELTLIKPLWEQIPDHSMTLVDRGLHSWWAFHQLTSQGTERHWATRARSNLSFRVVERLGREDQLVAIQLSHHIRKEHPEAPEEILVRRIRVARKGYRPTWLLTSATASERYPASELRSLYVERWEIELAYDEIKNHLLEQETTLRSKTPEGVAQEIYGMGLAYNLVRLELARLADRLRVEPRRLSFHHALRLLRTFMLQVWSTSPGAIPKRLNSLEQHLQLLVLPPRRARSCPRKLKHKRTKYRYFRRRPAGARFRKRCTK